MCLLKGQLPFSHIYQHATSTERPPGLTKAVDAATSDGSSLSGELHLLSFAQTQYSQTNGYSSYSRSMNYASGPSASVNPYVFSSATSNNKQTIPVVIADFDASSGRKAALGVVNNMDQAKPNIDNATTMKAMGQS